MSERRQWIEKDRQYYKFSAYGFLKNLRFFEPFLILFFLEKGVSYFEIGVLYAVREILVNIFEIPSGFIADAFGRRRTMVFSLFAYILSFVVFFFSNAYIALIGAMVLYALGDAFRTGTHKAMIYTYINANGMGHLKGAYYGHTRSWSQTGSAISALIAALLVFYTESYSPIFLFTLIPYVLDLFLILSYPQWLDGNEHTKGKSPKELFTGMLTALAKSFRQMALMKGMLNQSLYSGYYKALKDYIQPMIVALTITSPFLTSYDDVQRSAFFTGAVYSVLYFTTSFASKKASYFAGRFSSESGALNFFFSFGAWCAVASAITFAFSLPLFSVLLFFGIYLVENIRKPVGLSYLSSLMDETILAASLSVESQLETLFAVLFSLLVGGLTSLFSLEAALLATSGVLLVSSFMVHLRDHD